MDNEMAQFQEDLLLSVRQMKAEKAAHITEIALPLVTEVRHAAGLSQVQFARLIGVSVRTLQHWEQGRCSPSGAVRTLIRVAEKHPEFLLDLS